MIAWYNSLNAIVAPLKWDNTSSYLPHALGGMVFSFLNRIDQTYNKPLKTLRQYVSRATHLIRNGGHISVVAAIGDLNAHKEAVYPPTLITNGTHEDREV